MKNQTCSTRSDSRQLHPIASGIRRIARVLLRTSCIVGFLLATLAARAQSVDIFMRIGGQAAAMGATQTAPMLAGESTDPQYTNWIPVLSMSHGVSRTVSLSLEPGGSVSATRAFHTEVAMGNTIDKTTPSINLLVNGVTATVSQPIDYVTIDFRRSGGSTQVFYRMELQGVYFTSASVTGRTDVPSITDFPSQSLSLFYTKIRWSYVPFDSNGKAQTTITKGWDVAKSESF